jgi:tRNA (guanine37-N1)-methyltransferase
MHRIDFVTLFPEMVLGAVEYSIVGRAQRNGLVSFSAVNPREFATDKRGTVDDTPYGGGPGMLMKPEPIDAALASLHLASDAVVILPDPTGRLFRQEDAIQLSGVPRMVFLCGHYEGIDERVSQKWVTHRFSIGDYVLTGGELPALVMAEAIVRNVEGVLGDAKSLGIDSHSDGMLSAPQYTRPEVWEGRSVPEVLTSGDHGAITRWKRAQSLLLTRRQRPDLFARAPLAKFDIDLLQSGFPPEKGDDSCPDGSDS